MSLQQYPYQTQLIRASFGNNYHFGKCLMQVHNSHEHIGGGPMLGLMRPEFDRVLSVNPKSVPFSQVISIQFTWEVQELFIIPRALSLENSRATFLYKVGMCEILSSPFSIRLFLFFIFKYLLSIKLISGPAIPLVAVHSCWWELHGMLLFHTR